MALPTVQILLDDGTGTFPHDVTAYARLLDGFSFNRGREDGQASVTAGSLSLALNNADGRFTPGSTTIASPSPITVDQRIRLKETVNGTTFTRFTGYVKSWRVMWPAAVDTHSVVQVTATDAQARAERRILRSVVEEEILADSPLAYYTLGEPEGSASAGDSSGNQAPALTMAGSGTDVVFGNATGPGTDGLTAAEFAGGQWLQADLPSTPAAVECWFATTTNDATARLIISDEDFHDPMIGGVANLFNGNLYAVATDTGVAVDDGLVHHIIFVSGVGLYCDGVLVGASATTLTGTSLQVGGMAGANSPFIGSIAHSVAYSLAPSAARITAHYQAGSGGFAGESGTDRITRLAGYAGIPLGTLDTSLTNVAFKDGAGTTAWSAIAEVTDAEGGLTLVDGDGDTVFTNRNDAPEKTAPDLTVAAEFVDFNAAPTDDDAELLNYVETTAEGTQVTQVVRDAASEDAHGRYSDSKTYLVETDPEALDRANWLVGNYAEPTTRFGTLTINLFGMSAAQQESAVSALAPGAWLRVTDMPSQTPGGTTVDVMVQGFTEEQSASSWSLTCNVVARSLFEAWILGDSTWGVLDSTTRLYV